MAPREIAPGVFVATSPVYLTTTTLVVGHGGGCLVIDPALTAPEVAGLGDWLAARGLRAVAGWATHAHWDHVLWSPALGVDVPRYATPRAVQTCARNRQAMISEMSAEAPGHDLDLFGRLEPVPGPGSGVVPWDGPEARVVAHDAHSGGHGAIFLPTARVLIAGDMLSDVEIPLLDLPSGTVADPGERADPFGGYRAGLGLLASQLSAGSGVRYLVPGHGQVGDRREFRRRVAADFRYLDLVEAGREAADPRLLVAGAEWLRAEHARQARLARSQLT